MKKILNYMKNIKKDKLLHFFWGAIISAPLIYFFGVFGFFLSFVLILVKEGYDAKTKGNVELLDVVFGLVPAILILLMKLTNF